MRLRGAVQLRCMIVVVVALVSFVAVVFGEEANLEANSVYVRQIVTDPSEILTEAEINEVVYPFQGREVTLDELLDMVQRINARYAARGYVTAQAVLPPQTIDDGVVYVMLIEGRVGEMTVQGNHSTQSGYVTRRMSLDSGDLVRLETLEADIERFNATNDVQLSAQLKPGQAFGTTDVVLVLSEPPRLQGAVSYGNAGRNETGVGQSGITLTNRSVLGRRDALDLSWSKSIGSQSRSLSYDFPVSHMGSRMVIRYSQSETGIVEGEIAELNMGTKSYGGGIGWNIPLVLEPGVRVDGLVDYHDNRLETYFSELKVSSSQVRRFALGFSSQNSWERSVLQMQHLLTHGTATDSKSESSFVKYNASFTHQALITDHHTLRLRVNTQLSSVRLLPPSEQFSLGGGGTVRGYPSGKLIGDQGYFVSADITAPLTPGLNAFVFLDHGATFPYRGNDMPASADDYATSIGAGVTLSLYNRLIGNLVYGVPLDANYRSEGDFGTLHLHFELRF